MTAFWQTFLKKAAEQGIIADWLDESAEEDKKLKSPKEDERIDPRELSEWRSPDTWYRYWP